jgi:hypothetical protein
VSKRSKLAIRTFNPWRFPATLGTISKINKIRNTQLIQFIAPIFKQRRFQKLSLKITTKYGARNDKRGKHKSENCVPRKAMA